MGYGRGPGPQYVLVGVVMAYIVMDFTVMAFIVMAYVVMAYIVMALGYRIVCLRVRTCGLQCRPVCGHAAPAPSGLYIHVYVHVHGMCIDMCV